MRNIYKIFLLLSLLVFEVTNANTIYNIKPESNISNLKENDEFKKESFNIQKLLMNKDDKNKKVANMSCGLPPLPPLGCQIGACVCNQYGQNCQWTFICR